MGFISDLLGTLEARFRISTNASLNAADGDLNAENFGGTAKIPVGAHTAKLYGSNAAYNVSLTAPADLSENVALVLPSGPGSLGQVMGTDGSGNLTFINSISNGELCQEESFTQATSSPATIFTPPASAVITRVQIEISSAAAGGSPTASVGISGDADRDMDETDSILTFAGIYEVSPMTAVGETPAAIVLTLTPDGQSFTGKVRVWYVIPA